MCSNNFGPGFKTIKSIGKVEGTISKEKKGNMDLDMIQYLYQKGYNKTFSEMKPSKKFGIDHRYIAFKKIRKFF